MKHSGSLNIYFPCEIGTKAVSRLRKKWENRRKRQRDFIERNGLPGTDLLDLEDYRDETEEILRQFISHYLPTFECECSPFATKGIRKSYHGKREDTLFSKNLSVIVKRVFLTCNGKDFIPKNKEGLVILNVNAENNVGTIIISIPFSSLIVEEVIFLKHIFYKRLKVTITDSRSGQTEANTIQQYISDLIHSELRLLKIKSVDYRARYSLLELNVPYCMRAFAKEYYGILKADESYKFVKEENLTKTFEKNLFNIYTRGYYVDDTNGLVLHDIQRGDYNFPPNNFRFYQNLIGTDADSDKTRNDLRDLCELHKWNGHISIIDEKYEILDDVAGTKNNLFPEFLRAVEIHYMLDKVLTSEIDIQKRDQLNPLIFIPRAYKLWLILYDRAVNKYHINGGIMKSFGIDKSISDVKEEYASLQQLIINFLLIVLAALTFIATFFKL